jgi:RNA recognition motif-containing protein
VTKRNGRSKGFGFVEFKNTEDQQKALAAVEKKQVQGRDLIVKVALTDQVHHEGKADAPAAAPAAAAPAAEKK